MFVVCLQVVAESTKHQDPAGARRLGKASLGMSISGIIVTIIIIAIAVGVSVGTASSTYRYSASVYCNYGYTVNGVCYSSRRYVSSLSYCYYTYKSCCYSYEDLYYSGYCYDL